MNTDLDGKTDEKMTPRQRVRIALKHQEPDRTPVDFLATPEVWNKLIAHYQPDSNERQTGEYHAPDREAVLQELDIDCRVVSYDMFCAPPEDSLRKGAAIDWWSSLARSTPNRMWRQSLPDGSAYDI